MKPSVGPKLQNIQRQTGLPSTNKIQSPFFTKPLQELDAHKGEIT